MCWNILQGVCRIVFPPIKNFKIKIARNVNNIVIIKLSVVKKHKLNKNHEKYDFEVSKVYFLETN